MAIIEKLNTIFSLHFDNPNKWFQRCSKKTKLILEQTKKTNNETEVNNFFRKIAIKMYYSILI